MEIKIKNLLKLGAYHILFVLVVGVIWISIALFTTNSNNKSIEIVGVIQNKRVDDNHSTPYFLIKNKWEYVGLYGYSMMSNIQVGDSIIKKSGSSYVLIYRKNQLDEYKLHGKVTKKGYFLK